MHHKNRRNLKHIKHCEKWNKTRKKRKMIGNVNTHLEIQGGVGMLYIMQIVHGFMETQNHHLHKIHQQSLIDRLFKSVFHFQIHIRA